MTVRPADLDDGGLVCIGRAYLWHEGQQILTSLQAAGFSALLLDGQINYLMSQNNIVLGGARLMVPRAQAEAAFDFLKNLPPMSATRLSTRARAVFAVLVAWQLAVAGIAWMSVAPAWRGVYLYRPVAERRM